MWLVVLLRVKSIQVRPFASYNWRLKQPFLEPLAKQFFINNLVQNVLKGRVKFECIVCLCGLKVFLFFPPAI